MKIALHEAENNGYPNLALMKLSAFHKSIGNDVSMFNPLFKYESVYSSKVFTYTKGNDYLPRHTQKGGTGYNLSRTLPDAAEHIMPDYSLYKIDYSMGFLTRGCPRNCSWCIVPDKEGDIKPYADITEFWNGQRKAVLLDNNVLSCDHGLRQIEKIIDLGIRIDFNQGLDARIIAGNKDIADLLTKVRWSRFLRMACDTANQIPFIEKALENLNNHGFKNYKVFVYVLVKNIPDALKRVKFLKKKGVDPFAQPYRDFNTNKEPEKELKEFARWVNHKAIFKTTTWENYKGKSNG